MAKLKTDTPEDNQVDVQVKETPQTTPPKEQPKKEPVKTKETPVTPKATAGKTEVPDFADRILKAFPTYKELYIDNQGGAFTPDSPANVRGEATLYKNPYYKA